MVKNTLLSCLARFDPNGIIHMIRQELNFPKCNIQFNEFDDVRDLIKIQQITLKNFKGEKDFKEQYDILFQLYDYDDKLDLFRFGGAFNFEGS